MTNDSGQKWSPSEIDFSAVFAILWRRRRLVVLGTVIATILAAGMSLLIPRAYRSEAFYQLGSGGVSIPLFKNSSSMFTNPNRFLSYAHSMKWFSDKENRRMAQQFQEAQHIQKWVDPLYAFSKEDQKQLAAVGSNMNNAVLGLNLAYEGMSPQKAARMVSFFGRYVRDCLMYVTLFNYISDNVSEAHIVLQKNENNLSENRFRFEQQEKKKEDIRAILGKYPDAARVEIRQLVSLQDGGARFLSPVTQLVGIESAMADLRREAAELRRNREKLQLRVEFFDAGKAALSQANEKGELLFQKLQTAHRELFAKKDLKRDPVREVFNELSVDQQSFDRTFNLAYRFISGPTVPTRHVKPHRAIIVLVSFFLAGVFFVGLSLILAWWQSHKRAILADTK